MKIKNGHIRNIVDTQGLAGLSAAEKIEIENHVSVCADCAEHLRLANAVDLLIKSRLKDVVEPSPFFATRVMAAVREKKFETESHSIWGLWRMAKTLVTGMAATVVVLGGLTLYSGGLSSEAQGPIATATGYNTEHVLFQDGYQYANYDPTNGQVYQSVLGPEDTDGDY